MSFEGLHLSRADATMAHMAKKSRTQDRHAPNRTLRIPEALYKELERVAASNERPVQWEARIAIRKHIRQQRDESAEESQP